jgi:hypothetical protein
MEKYNAETMAIVPRKPTENMVENGDTQDVINLEDSYCLMVDSAPQVEPVVPLSEVLELLDLEGMAYDNERIEMALIKLKNKLKQKYGVSE